MPEKSSLTPLKVLLAALFAGVIVAFFALGGLEHLSLDAVKANRENLVAFAQSHFVLSLLLAFAVYVAAVAFSLPIATVLSLAAGFVFGRWFGTALIVLAATTGATLAFLAARFLFAEAAQRRLGPLGAKINAGFTANAFSYLLFLRLVPLFPFFLVNLAPALTNIPVRTFIGATLIGIIPGTFVYVNLGQALGRIESTQSLVAPEFLGAFALLGALALVPVLWKKLRRGPDRVT
jgi:uncharacterized membrane protein YdjX (TVP38/TMEM64 family)